jgi:hypothetical protein
VKTSTTYWRQPVKWNREAEASGKRRRVFCASLADVFEDWDGPIVGSNGLTLYRDAREKYTDMPGAVGIRLPITDATMDDLRRDLFALIDATPHLDWLLLSKRPENICPMWVYEAHHTGPVVSTVVYRPNCWLLTSVATQVDADRNAPLLVECRDLVPVLGLSVEPMLGPVDLELDGIDWCIFGCESGPKRRPCEVEWVANGVEQCRRAGVAAFNKQLSINGRVSHDPAEWPADLRIRQFPAAAAVGGS